MENLEHTAVDITECCTAGLTVATSLGRVEKDPHTCAQLSVSPSTALPFPPPPPGGKVHYVKRPKGAKLTLRSSQVDRKAARTLITCPALHYEQGVQPQQQGQRDLLLLLLDDTTSPEAVAPGAVHEAASSSQPAQHKHKHKPSAAKRLLDLLEEVVQEEQPGTSGTTQHDSCSAVHTTSHSSPRAPNGATTTPSYSSALCLDNACDGQAAVERHAVSLHVSPSSFPGQEQDLFAELNPLLSQGASPSAAPSSGLLTERRAAAGPAVTFCTAGHRISSSPTNLLAGARRSQQDRPHDYRKPLLPDDFVAEAAVPCSAGMATLPAHAPRPLGSAGQQLCYLPILALPAPGPGPDTAAGLSPASDGRSAAGASLLHQPMLTWVPGLQHAASPRQRQQQPQLQLHGTGAGLLRLTTTQPPASRPQQYEFVDLSSELGRAGPGPKDGAREPPSLKSLSQSLGQAADQGSPPSTACTVGGSGNGSVTATGRARAPPPLPTPVWEDEPGPAPFSSSTSSLPAGPGCTTQLPPTLLLPAPPPDSASSASSSHRDGPGDGEHDSAGSALCGIGGLWDPFSPAAVDQGHGACAGPLGGVAGDMTNALTPAAGPDCDAAAAAASGEHAVLVSDSNNAAGVQPVRSVLDLLAPLQPTEPDPFAELDPLREERARQASRTHALPGPSLKSIGGMRAQAGPTGGSNSDSCVYGVGGSSNLADGSGSSLLVAAAVGSEGLDDFGDFRGAT